MFNKPNRLSRVTSACGLALLASLALVALAAPSSAFAAGPKIEGTSFPLSFTVTNSGAAVTVQYSNGPVMECSSSSGAGTWTTNSSGTATLTFQGCTRGFTCTSPGQPSGTIVTSTLGIQSVYLNKARTKFGMLFTPPASGVFAEVVCGPFGIKTTWNGGLIGETVSPGLGGTSSESTLRFLNSGVGKQQWTQVEESGPVYQLTQGAATLAILANKTVKYPKNITWAP
jgi:hypothetical protein